jgi:hypothetical protein
MPIHSPKCNLHFCFRAASGASRRCPQKQSRDRSAYALVGFGETWEGAVQRYGSRVGSAGRLLTCAALMSTRLPGVNTVAASAWPRFGLVADCLGSVETPRNVKVRSSGK